AAEARVAFGADRLNLELAASQETLDPTPARAMHRIDHDVRARPAHPFEINVRRYLRAITFDRAIKSAARFRAECAPLRLVRVNERLNLDGPFGRRAAAPRRFDLEAIELGRTVRSCDDHA